MCIHTFANKFAKPVRSKLLKFEPYSDGVGENEKACGCEKLDSLPKGKVAISTLDCYTAFANKFAKYTPNISGILIFHCTI